jgi:hypothetical protein
LPAQTLVETLQSETTLHPDCIRSARSARSVSARCSAVHRRVDPRQSESTA